MPKLLLETEIKLKWTDILGRASKEKFSSDSRSPGIHLSGIIRYCMGYQDRQADDPDELPLNMAFGLAWEAWAVGLFPAVMWQPGEESLDGVYATPDGLSSLDIDGQAEIVVEEWKATWKSLHTHPDILTQTGWMWQLAALCHMQGLRHARIHVLYVNGDYRPPKPRYITYLLEFTTTELERFWQNCILKNKDKAIPEEGINA